MPASAANFTDMWQEYGSEARFAEMDREFALAEKTGSTLVSTTGFTAVFYRENPEKTSK